MLGCLQRTPSPRLSLVPIFLLISDELMSLRLALARPMSMEWVNALCGLLDQGENLLALFILLLVTLSLKGGYVCRAPLLQALSTLTSSEL